MKAIWTILVVMLLSATGFAADEANEPVKLSGKRAVVFKDGYGLIVREGDAITSDAATVTVTEVPDSAVLGAFWAAADRGRILAMRAGWEEFAETATETVVCNNPTDVLIANQGKACQLTLANNSNVAGTILAVPGAKSQPATATEPQRVWDPYRGWIMSTPPAVNAGPTHVVIRTQEGDRFLAIASIQAITIEAMKLERERETTATTRRKRLTLHFAEKNQPRHVSLLSFEPTIRWIPAYRILLGEEAAKTASISLQAEIINEAADFDEAAIDLVVGVPNFRFRDIVSPFVLEAQLNKVLSVVAPQLATQMMSNSFQSAQRGSPQPPSTGAIALPDELTTGSAQDLFLYQVKALTMKKGERVGVPLFSGDVPVQHVYTWQPRLKTAYAVPQTDGGTASPLQVAMNEVWHQIDLRNSTSLPWTTGSAMLMQGAQPLAQEMLTYTSVGNTARIPITVAVDLQGSVNVEELSRKLDALRWNSHMYAEFTNRASLRLHNSKPIPVTAEIVLRLGGKVSEATTDAKVVVTGWQGDDWENYQGASVVNHHSDVRWQVTIPPGADFTAEATYSYYLRH